MELLKLIYLNTMFYLFFFLFSLLSIPFLTVSILCLSIFLSRRRIMTITRRAISWYGTVIIKVLPFPLIRILYKDNAREDLDSAGIFVCNHRSASDAFLMACLPYECIQVVNIWPLRIPILGTIARLAGYLSVNEMPFEEFARRAGDFLKQGASIITFPEGTRSGNRTLGHFHGSIFRIALQERYPLVPICISGNENIPSRGSLLLRPGIIKIHKLPSLRWHDYKHLTPFKLKNKIRTIIANELAIMENTA